MLIQTSTLLSVGLTVVEEHHMIWGNFHVLLLLIFY